MLYFRCVPLIDESTDNLNQFIRFIFADEFSIVIDSKNSTESKTITFDCNEAIKIYKAVFEEAKKEFAE